MKRLVSIALAIATLGFGATACEQSHDSGNNGLVGAVSPSGSASSPTPVASAASAVMGANASK